MTGCYPRDHGIIGAHWYDRDAEEVVYFGDDLWSVFKNGGPGAFYRDFVARLNNERIRRPTLFSLVERAGLEACSLNYLIFAGDHPHQIGTPGALRLIPDFDAELEVRGPRRLALGDFYVRLGLELTEEDVRPGSVVKEARQRFGMNDERTARLLLELAERDALPDFTLAYFPDNDLRSHEQGPARGHGALERLDVVLGELVDRLGGWERALQGHCLVMTGDHAQCELYDQERAGINLDEVLGSDFPVAPINTLPSGEQVVVCENLRATQIYLGPEAPAHRAYALADRLLADDRVDQVMLDERCLDPNAFGFLVRTADRGQLRFRRGTLGPQVVRDVYGQRWSIKGDLGSIGGFVVDGRLETPSYPDALERIAGCFETHTSGSLWATALPGHSFRRATSEAHIGGGSHGALHLLDSATMMLVAGAPLDLPLPSRPRVVDVAHLCLRALGIDPPPHVARPGAPSPPS